MIEHNPCHSRQRCPSSHLLIVQPSGCRMELFLDSLSVYSVQDFMLRLTGTAEVPLGAIPCIA